MRHSGTVQSFDEASGHGSIRPDNGGCDLSFETSDLSLVGMNSPKVGSRLTYHLSGKEGHASAVNVRRVFSLPSGRRRMPFTIFRSAAEEAATKAAHDAMDNEGATDGSSGAVQMDSHQTQTSKATPAPVEIGGGFL